MLGVRGREERRGGKGKREAGVEGLKTGRVQDW